MMQTEAEQRVIEVIPSRDRGEHSLDGLFPWLPGPLRYGPAGWVGRPCRAAALFSQWLHGMDVAFAQRLCQGKPARLIDFFLITDKLSPSSLS